MKLTEVKINRYLVTEQMTSVGCFNLNGQRGPVADLRVAVELRPGLTVHKKKLDVTQDRSQTLYVLGL